VVINVSNGVNAEHPVVRINIIKKMNIKIKYRNIS
jgi:hypothetical protein